jgi:hypothetical protein
MLPAEGTQRLVLTYVPPFEHATTNTMLALALTHFLPGARLWYCKICLQCNDAMVNTLDSAISRTMHHVVVGDVLFCCGILDRSNATPKCNSCFGLACISLDLD